MRNTKREKKEQERINLSLTPEAACLARKLQKKGVNLSRFFSEQLLWHFKRSVNTEQKIAFFTEAMNSLQDTRDRKISRHELDLKAFDSKIEALAEKKRLLKEEK